MLLGWLLGIRFLRGVPEDVVEEIGEGILSLFFVMLLGICFWGGVLEGVAEEIGEG